MTLNVLEEWMPVLGLERSYIVSNHGRVMGLRRIVEIIPESPDRVPFRRIIRGRMMKPKKLQQGHLMVTLSGGKGISLDRMVHRLVLEAFVGPCPPGTEGCHRDDDPENNNLSNLRWDIHLNNMKDMTRNGNSNRGAKATFTKLTEESVLQIKHMLNSGVTKKEIAATFGVTPSAISAIATKRTWYYLVPNIEGETP